MTAKESFNQCGFPYYDKDTEGVVIVSDTVRKYWGIGTKIIEIYNDGSFCCYTYISNEGFGVNFQLLKAILQQFKEFNLSVGMVE